MEAERGKQYRVRDAETLKRVLAGNFSHSPEMLAMAGRMCEGSRQQLGLVAGQFCRYQPGSVFETGRMAQRQGM